MACIYQIKAPSNIGKSEKDLRAAGFPVWRFSHNNLRFAISDAGDVSAQMERLVGVVGGEIFEPKAGTLKVQSGVLPLLADEFNALPLPADKPTLVFNAEPTANEILREEIQPEPAPVEEAHAAPSEEPPAPVPLTPLEYMRWFYGQMDIEPDYRVNVAAIGEHGLTGRTFNIADLLNPDSKEGDAFKAFIDNHGKAKRGIYYSAVPLKREPEKGKANKTDMVDAVQVVWRDQDPPKDCDEAGRQEWHKKTVAAATKASIVIDSGNGIQELWILTEPVTKERCEEINVIVTDAVGADRAATDVCRLLRMPGTVNYPNESKRKKGRTEKPASVLTIRERRMNPRSVNAAPGPGPVIRARAGKGDLLGLPPGAGAVIKTGQRPTSELVSAEKARELNMLEVKQYDGWSEARFRALGDMIAAKFSDDKMGNILVKYMASDKKGRDKQWALKEIERFRVKAADDWLRLINTGHFFALVGGKPTICYMAYDHVMKKKLLKYMGLDAFKAKFENQRIRRGTTTIGAGQAWLQNPFRREHEGVVLLPGEGPAVKGYHNLWRGYGVESKAGDCSLIKDHMLNVLCCGDQDHYRYLMGWLARLIQKPGEHGRVAVVLKGGKGIGKGLFVQYVGKLLGEHFYQLVSSDQLTGKFNDHLREVVLLFADEAVWGGDHKAESRLKALVTESTLALEKKFHDSERAKNLLHIIIAANADWAAPVTEKERRFFVLEPSDDRRTDREYFRAILHEQANGGTQALLQELQNYDLSGFDVTAVPVTDGLKDQAIRGVNTEVKFWYEYLSFGYVAMVRRAEFYDLYVNFAKKIGDQRPLALNLFMKAIGKMHPGSKHDPERKIKRVQTVETEVATNDPIRVNSNRFATLDECRKAFVDFMGWGDHEWPDPDECDGLLQD